MTFVITDPDFRQMPLPREMLFLVNGRAQAIGCHKPAPMAMPAGWRLSEGCANRPEV